MSRKTIFASLLTLPLLSACNFWEGTLTPTSTEPEPEALGQAVDPKQAEPTPVEYVERAEPAVGLQLGAFSKPQGASETILRLQQSYPLVFENRTPIIRAIERDGTKLYRVILGPFTKVAVANSFCKLLQQRGEVCFTTAFDRVDLRVDLIADKKEEE